MKNKNENEVNEVKLIEIGLSFEYDRMKKLLKYQFKNNIININQYHQLKEWYILHLADQNNKNNKTKNLK